jgi:hypothetical protein
MKDLLQSGWIVKSYKSNSLFYSSDHDNQRKVENHRNGKSCSDKDDPFAIAEVGAYPAGICLGPAFSGNNAYGNT